MAVQIQMRRDTAANWTQDNPILAQGEWGLETDTDNMKIGNGATNWTSLPYQLLPYSSVNSVISAASVGAQTYAYGIMSAASIASEAYAYGLISTASIASNAYAYGITSAASIAAISASETYAASVALQKVNNLSDVTNAGTARENIHIPVLAACQAVAAASVNTSLPGATFGGFTLTNAGTDQVLLPLQSGSVASLQNGPWIWNGASVGLTRPADYATGAAVKGRTVQINNGSGAGNNNDATIWALDTNATITVDTTPTAWSQVAYDPIGAAASALSSVVGNSRIIPSIRDAPGSAIKTAPYTPVHGDVTEFSLAGAVTLTTPIAGPSTATLSTSLSTGSPITSLPVNALAAAIGPGSVILTSVGVGESNDIQTFTTTGAAQGATSIPITSATPLYAFTYYQTTITAPPIQISALAVSALPFAVVAGTVSVVSGVNDQTFTTTGAVLGATSIPITTVTPNAAFAVGASVSLTMFQPMPASPTEGTTVTFKRVDSSTTNVLTIDTTDGTKFLVMGMQTASINLLYADSGRIFVFGYDGTWHVVSGYTSKSEVQGFGDARYIPTIYGSGDRTGATDLAAINAALLAKSNMGGGVVTLTGNNIWINGEMVTYDNTTFLLVNGTINLANGSNCPMITNSNNGTATNNVNISIQGIGRAFFNGRAAFQTRNTLYYQSSGMQLASITNLVIDGIQGGSNATFILLQGITNYRVTNINFEQDLTCPNQAGVWMNLACVNGFIDNLTGVTGDDVVPVSPVQNYTGAANPNLPYYMTNGGNTTDLHISNVDVDAGSYPVRLMAGDGFKLWNVQIDTVRNRNANNNCPIVGVGPASYVVNQPASTDIAHIIAVNLQGGDRYSNEVMIALDQNCSDLQFRGIHLINPWPHGLLGTSVSSAYAPTVDRVMVSGVSGFQYTSAAVGSLIQFPAGSTLTNFSVSDINLPACQSILANGAPIIDLELHDVHINTCFSVPFASTAPETGSMHDVTIDSLGSGVTQTYGYAMSMRLDGASVPIFTSADVLPTPTTLLSQIVCDQTVQPPGISGSDAGLYISNGIAWIKMVDLGSQLFSPGSLGPVCWWKADALGLTNGASVASWSDSSGNGHSLLQASSGAKPTFTTNVLNGLPVVEFNGTSHYMQTALFTLNQPLTIFIVGELRGTSASTRALLDGTSGGNRADVFFPGSSSAISLYALTSTLTGPTTTPDSLHVYVVTINGASSAIQVDSGTPTTGTTGTSSPEGFTVGALENATGFADLNLGELIVYNSVLSAPNIAKVVASLTSKWG